MARRTITVAMGGGRIRIPPEAASPELTDLLTYVRTEAKEVVRKSRDRDGRPVEIKVRTRDMVSRRVCMASEGPDGWVVTYDGLLARVVRFLKSRGFSVDVARTGPSPPVPRVDPSVARGLLPDQKDVLVEALSTVWDGERHLHAGAVVDATMGYGKTYVIAALCRAYVGERRVVVSTKSAQVVRRLVQGLSEMLEEDGISVGVRQGSKFDDGDVVVCTSAVLDRFPPEEVGCLVYDEVHNAASPEQTKAISRFSGSVRFGLTGTPGKRIDGRHNMVEALFGEKCVSVSDADAEDLGRVVPLRVLAVEVDNGPIVSAFRPRMSQVREERAAVVRNRHRNKKVAEAVAAAPDDWQVLVFVRTREHAEILVEGFLPPGTVLFHASLPPAEKRRILSGFEDGSIRRIVSTDAMGEGVDPSRLRVVVDANWTTTDAKVSQRAGRCRRKAPGKTLGYVVNFLDSFDPTTRRRSNQRLLNYRKRGYEVVPVGPSDEIRYEQQ